MGSNKSLDDKLTLIYYIQDPRNSKIVYVGKTINFPRRIKEHLSSQDETPIRRWIRKTLRNNHRPKFIPLISTIFKYSAELEQKMICEFKTKKPYGYNLTDGGEGHLGHFHSEKTKRILREKAKKRGGKKHSDETKLKIRMAKLGKKRPNFKLTPEGLQKKRELGKLITSTPAWKAKFCKSIRDQHNNIYESVQSAANQLGINVHYIYDHLKGKYPSCKGYKFTQIESIHAAK